MLVAIVSGASVFVYSAIGGYSASLKGASISVSNASIRQGSSLAIETLQIANNGNVQFSSITLMTSGISTASTYSGTLESPVTGSLTSFSGSGPGSIVITTTLPPGQSILVTITIKAGNVFNLGTGYSLYVAASGASAQQAVSALPA